MPKAGNYYDEDEDFSGFRGEGKPRNPKGIFVVPTGSVSMINVSSSIKGGSVGSTKDTLDLLTNLGTEYDEPWHEAVHYLDKRVSELSIGLNAVADSNTNLSGSVGALGSNNKEKLFKSSGSLSTRVTLNDAKVTNSDQSKADINALDITEVGTISSGVWQGTTIKTAYIGNDQITEAKLANTLLAEIDANTAKVTNSDQDLSSLALKTQISGSFFAPSASFSTRVTLNDAKVTNADQSKSDIDGLGITTVGTIDTGVWQGTTIKTAYIGNDQITEDKLANTLLAEIDANTAKVTNSDQSKADINALDITEVGTISSGVWQGTTIKTAYIGDDQITEDKLANTLLAEIDANTAKVTNSDQSKADINALDITEVGTISSGVWQGTTIKTAYIGNDQVTEDKLANTLLAEIDANTAKVGTTSTERSRIAANHAKVGITTSQASAITANTAKVGSEVDLTGNASEGIILKATIGNNRGAYSIKFTMTDSSGRTTVQKSAVINLE